MDIELVVIPHHDQRYETVGDWQLDAAKRKLVIRVSEVGNWRMEFLVQFHELIESILCLDRGITTEEVDKFDIAYEAKRDVDDESEPGDSPEAPYRKEHFFATTLERLMAAELRIDWATYEEELNKLEL